MSVSTERDDEFDGFQPRFRHYRILGNQSGRRGFRCRLVTAISSRGAEGGRREGIPDPSKRIETPGVLLLRSVRGGSRVRRAPADRAFQAIYPRRGHSEARETRAVAVSIHLSAAPCNKLAFGRHGRRRYSNRIPNLSRQTLKPFGVTRNA